MLINVVDLTYGNNEEINSITVTDGETFMNVTPYMIFDAILNGRMESQTARLNIYGLDILVNSEVINIQVTMTKEQKKILKSKLGIAVEKEKKTTKSVSKEVSAKAEQVKQAKKAKIEKEARLAAEREAFRIKQQQWFDENKRKADEARSRAASTGERIRPKAILKDK